MFYHPVLLFFDISGGELLVIILVVFLVFGPDKMPEIARKMGRAVNHMKKASNDLTREFREETSGLRDDLRTIQNKVTEEYSGVTQEINKTRARVISDLTVPEDKPADEPVISPSSPESADPPPGNLPDPTEGTGKAG